MRGIGNAEADAGTWRRMCGGGGDNYGIFWNAAEEDELSDYMERR